MRHPLLPQRVDMLPDRHARQVEFIRDALSRDVAIRRAQMRQHAGGWSKPRKEHAWVWHTYCSRILHRLLLVNRQNKTVRTNHATQGAVVGGRRGGQRTCPVGFTPRAGSPPGVRSNVVRRSRTSLLRMAIPTALDDPTTQTSLRPR